MQDRYQKTSTELFPDGGERLDGGHFGYLNLASQLAHSDYPIACFAPMDSTGAYLLGATTFEAIETEIFANRRYAQARIISCPHLGGGRR